MNCFAINKLEAILLQLSFCLVVGAITTGDVCLSWHSSPCVGGDRGLTSTAVELNYVSIENGNTVIFHSLQLLKNTTYNVTRSLNYSVVDKRPPALMVVLLTFIQYEHGGGKCNCVDIYFNNNCKDDQNRYDLLGKGVYLFF